MVKIVYLVLTGFNIKNFHREVYLMKTVHWGILGTAKIAQTQLIPAIKRSRNTEVVAIASRSEKVHEIAEKLEIPKAYESYEALLNDPEIDVIYIFHYQIIYIKNGLPGQLKPANMC